MRGALVLNNLNTYTNNFNFPFLAKGTNTNQWTNNSGIRLGWYWQNIYSPLTYAAGNALTANNVKPYSFGSADERSMGNFGGQGNNVTNFPANPHTAWGVVLQNGTADVIRSILVAYTGEQWRGDNVVADSIRFSYTTSATEITDLMPTAGEKPEGWTASLALKFVTPNLMSSVGTTEGDLPENQVRLSTALPVTVLPGEYLALRWYDGDDPGIDSAMGIDDLSVSFFTTVIPEASAFKLGALLAATMAALHFVRRR